MNINILYLFFFISIYVSVCSGPEHNMPTTEETKGYRHKMSADEIKQQIAEENAKPFPDLDRIRELCRLNNPQPLRVLRPKFSLSAAKLAEFAFAYGNAAGIRDAIDAQNQEPVPDLDLIRRLYELYH